MSISYYQVTNEENKDGPHILLCGIQEGLVAQIPWKNKCVKRDTIEIVRF